jgi:UDP-glucose 4-epimerase
VNVLVTGGAGYVGLELVYALAADPRVRNITIYDLLNRDNYNVFTGARKLHGATLKLVEDDLLNGRALSEVVAKHDVIFHCAAQTPTQNFASASHIFEQNNHWGTASLVDAISGSDSPKRLINLSTLAVYGSGLIEDLNQELRPDDAYSLSKVRAEKQLLRLVDDTEHTVVNVRSPVVFGYSKNLRIDQMINRMIFDARMRGRVQVFGGADVSLPHVYIRDLVSLLISLLDGLPQYLNVIPTPQQLSVRDVLGLLEANSEERVDAVFVDQNVYRKSLKIGEGVPTILSNRPKMELADQIAEFLDQFIV